MPEKTKTGASFFNNPATGVTLFPDTCTPDISVKGRKIFMYSPERGVFRIHHISGAFLAGNNLIPHEIHEVEMKPGIYVVQAYIAGKGMISKKLLIL